MNINTFVRKSEQVIEKFDAARARILDHPLGDYPGQDIDRSFRRVEIYLGGSLFGLRELVKEYRAAQGKEADRRLMDERNDLP